MHVFKIHECSLLPKYNIFCSDLSFLSLMLETMMNDHNSIQTTTISNQIGTSLVVTLMSLFNKSFDVTWKLAVESRIHEADEAILYTSNPH